jgi:hypothetical protein
MPHYPMDQLSQTTVGHHQPNYSMKALKQDWDINFEGSQGHISLGMLAPSIVAEALEVLQKTGVVHTKLTPPVNNILKMRRQQVIPQGQR